MNTDSILDAFYQMVKDIIEGITMPTGQGLMPTFFYALGITVLSMVFTILDVVPVFDWRGGLVATGALGVLVFIERRGMNEVSRLYRVAKSRAAAVASRAKRPGSRGETVGAVDAGDTDVQAE